MVRGFYQEMPHIRVPGTQQSIDLQIEDRTADEVIELIHDIANGIPIVDKWGRSIEIDNEDRRREFIREIGSNSFFQNMLTKFSDNERRLIQVILSLVE